MAEGKIKYVGVDGCPAGWFSVGLDDGDCFDVEQFKTFSELVAYYSNAKLILVDMPIGLLDSGYCDRLCDMEAVGKMGPRRSNSVFPVPSRKLLEEISKIDSKLDYKKRYDEANKLSQYIDGGVLSPPSFGIVPKIGEVDAVMRETNAAKSSNIREVHPEICFWALNDGCVTQYSKKNKGSINPEGMRERIDILKRYENQIDLICRSARSKYPSKSKVGEDDILDALAAAVTAKLGCQDNQYTLQTLPANPRKDSHGLPMEMVYLASK